MKLRSDNNNNIVIVTAAIIYLIFMVVLKLCFHLYHFIETYLYIIIHCITAIFPNA